MVSARVILLGHVHKTPRATPAEKLCATVISEVSLVGPAKSRTISGVFRIDPVGSHATMDVACLDLGLAQDDVGRGGEGWRDDEWSGARDDSDRPDHVSGSSGSATKEYRVRRGSGREGRRDRITIPAGRVGMPDEYGPMGAFLASDKAGYITGSMIRVDGGRIRGMV
jgi:hypothetical protein